MPVYVLDTNHVGLAVSRGSAVRQRLEQALKEGSRFGTCVPVLCELEAGILQVRHPEAYRQQLRRLLHHVRVWPLDLETALLYGQIYHQLKNRGRVLSPVDMMVAALAKQLRLTVLTTDGDFDALPELRVEDWSKP